MQPTNISFTVAYHLCSGCGICVGVCPKQCIRWNRDDSGIYEPVIDSACCVECGLCVKVCPGLEHRYKEESESAAVRGNVLLACNAWSCDPEIRKASASGGVVSTLVQMLLRRGDYEIAFLVDSYDYRTQIITQPVTAQDVGETIAGSSYPKSRYLPVSHENAVSYANSHREKKIIVVATACAIRGFSAAIEQLGLAREHYLLIGLFCDRVFTYNVANYYAGPAFCGNKELKKLHFKNKESGGWPGNMKFFFGDGSTAFQDKAERIKVKDYFMPERCLYCLDKLNVCADISLGDNYTQQDASPLGSNSVIIRTELGLTVWDRSRSLLESRKVSMEQIMEAQYIDWRLNRLYYGKLKEKTIQKQSGQTIFLNKGIKPKGRAADYYDRWRQNLRMIGVGEQYSSHTKKAQRQMDRMEKRKYQSGILEFAMRGCRYIKRRFRPRS